MWRTPGGDRVLNPGEWALAQAGLARAWDAVEAARETPGGPGPTGVRAFDNLQHGQQVGLLAQIGRALSDPAVPAPPLTAATEGAVAAVFAVLRAGLDLELTAAGLPGFEEQPPHVGRVCCWPKSTPTQTSGTFLLEEIESRLFWHREWEMADEFLDLVPDAARERFESYGIDADYFTAVPDDLAGGNLEYARRELARLTGRTAADRSEP